MAGVNIQNNSTRLYEYTKVFGEVTKSFDNYFELPKLTIYNQYNSGLCVGYSLATAAEILWGKKFSPGWNYGKFRDDNHKGKGLFLLKALEYFCKIGTVPLADFTFFEDVPTILELVNGHPELLEIAKNFRIEGYCNLDYAYKDRRDKCIKDALSRYEEGVAVVATSNSFFWENHCITIVGWNDKTDSYIYQNSAGNDMRNETEGRGEIPKEKIDAIYAVFIKPYKLPFKDVPENHWAYKDIKTFYLADLINGTTEDMFEPDRPITRAEVVAMNNRMLAKIDRQNERNAIINYQKEMIS